MTPALLFKVEHRGDIWRLEVAEYHTLDQLSALADVYRTAFA